VTEIAKNAAGPLRMAVRKGRDEREEICLPDAEFEFGVLEELLEEKEGGSEDHGPPSAVHVSIESQSRFGARSLG